MTRGSSFVQKIETIDETNSMGRNRNPRQYDRNIMRNCCCDIHWAVHERANFYRKKKAKSKQLLYRCVPKPVDTKLLEGDTAEPD